MCLLPVYGTLYESKLNAGLQLLNAVEDPKDFRERLQQMAQEFLKKTWTTTHTPRIVIYRTAVFFIEMNQIYMLFSNNNNVQQQLYSTPTEH